MSIMDNLKSAFDVLLHPGKETKKGMSIGDALKFYYSVMIIPLILGVIVSLALNASNLTVGVISVAGILLSFVVLFPIGILVDAGLYHLVIGRLFKLYKGDYSKPVMAFTYAMMPSVLVYWLVGPLTSKAGFLGGLAGVAPALGATYVVGEVLSIIFGIWSIVIMIIALSNQVAISRLKALGTLLLEWIIIGIIASVLAMIFAVSLVGTGLAGPGGPGIPLGSSCIPGTGYACTGLAYSSNHLNFTFGQATGSDWTGTILYAVPSGTAFSTSDGNDAIGSLASGQYAQVSIPVLTSGSSTFVGSIWAVYNIGNTTDENIVATVTAPSK